MKWKQFKALHSWNMHPVELNLFFIALLFYWYCKCKLPLVFTIYFSTGLETINLRALNEHMPPAREATALILPKIICYFLQLFAHSDVNK